jgi:DNA-binding response OmpR family regulator
MAKILIVDDDVLLAQMLSDVLVRHNHMVEQAHDGNSAMELLEFSQYDLLVLDWQLPQMSGVDLCSQLKKKASNQRAAPLVLMTTARSRLNDKVQGLNAGADDYMTKPLDLDEFSARITALLRRAGAEAMTVIRYKDVVLEPESGTVKRGERKVKLGPKELGLLELLMRQPGEYLSTEAILSRLWNANGSRAGLANCLKRLRSQLQQGGEPDLIETSPGQGYRLN